MRILPTLACVSIATLLSACGQASDGYYDANGRYMYYTTENRSAYNHGPLNEASMPYTYDRRGYYEYDGRYIEQAEYTPNVPKNMFPPRGMCRVWFTDRPLRNQPPVESCNTIRTRVPAGAYVIYGG